MTIDNLGCSSAYGKPFVYVYVDDGNTRPGFEGKFVVCQIFETLSEGGTMTTCVYRCHCVQSSCKEVYVRFLNSAFKENVRICEIRSCYLF